MDHPPIFSSTACPCFSTPPEICSSRSGEVMFWGVSRSRHLRIWADCNPWEVNIPYWIIRRLEGCTCGVIDVLLYTCNKSVLSWFQTFTITWFEEEHCQDKSRATKENPEKSFKTRTTRLGDVPNIAKSENKGISWRLTLVHVERCPRNSFSRGLKTFHKP